MEKKVRDFPTNGPNSHYNTQQMYILTHFATFKKWKNFQSAVSFVNGMKKRNLYYPFCLYLHRHGDFLKDGISNVVVTVNFHKMFVGLTGDAFTSVHAADILDGIIMAVVKLLFPTLKDPNDPKSLLWISSAQDFLTGMDYGINTPMQGSLLHTRMQKKGLLRSHIDIGASLADEKNLLVTRQHKMLPKKEERIR